MFLIKKAILNRVFHFLAFFFILSFALISRFFSVFVSDSTTFAAGFSSLTASFARRFFPALSPFFLDYSGVTAVFDDSSRTASAWILPFFLFFLGLAAFFSVPSSLFFFASSYFYLRSSFDLCFAAFFF